MHLGGNLRITHARLYTPYRVHSLVFTFASSHWYFIKNGQFITEPCKTPLFHNRDVQKRFHRWAWKVNFKRCIIIIKLRISDSRWPYCVLVSVALWVGFKGAWVYRGRYYPLWKSLISKVRNTSKRDLRTESKRGRLNFIILERLSN